MKLDLDTAECTVCGKTRPKDDMFKCGCCGMRACNGCESDTNMAICADCNSDDE